MLKVIELGIVKGKSSEKARVYTLTNILQKEKWTHKSSIYNFCNWKKIYQAKIGIVRINITEHVWENTQDRCRGKK